MTIHVDEIFEFLVEHLRTVARDPQSRRRNHGADLYVSDVMNLYWSRQGISTEHQADEHVGAFYDAVADLCRIGVLRMGYRNPSVTGVASGGDLDHSDRRKRSGRTGTEIIWHRAL